MSNFHSPQSHAERNDIIELICLVSAPESETLLFPDSTNHMKRIGHKRQRVYCIACRRSVWVLGPFALPEQLTGNQFDQEENSVNAQKDHDPGRL